MSNPQEIKINILLIEDQDSWINVFKEISDDDANQIRLIRTIQSPRFALEFLKSKGAGEIDLIVMDYELGLAELTGAELTKIIKKSRPDLKIIFWSAYLAPERIEKAKEVGALGYFSKGLRNKDMVKFLIEALEETSPDKDKNEKDKLLIKLAKTDVASEFSPIEQKILEQLAKGKSYAEIAEHFLREEYDALQEPKERSFKEYLDECSPHDGKNEDRTRFTSRLKLNQNHIGHIKKKISLKLDITNASLPKLITFAYDYFSPTRRSLTLEEILGKNVFIHLSEGKTLNEIADIYGEVPDSIEKYLQEFLKIIFKTLKEASTTARVAMALNIVEANLRKYLGSLFMKHFLNGKSSKEIVRVYSIDPGLVEQLLQENKEQIIKKVKNGETVAEIAAELDLDESKLEKMITKWLDEDR